MKHIQPVSFTALYPRLAATDKDQVMQSLSWNIGRDEQFIKHADINFDGAALAHCLTDAEGKQSSSMGQGVAVLQFTTPHVNAQFTALARLTSRIDWQADDDQFVDLVAVVISPCKQIKAADEIDRETGMHLQKLSRITRFLLDVNCATELRYAENAEQMRAILNPDDLKHRAA